MCVCVIRLHVCVVFVLVQQTVQGYHAKQLDTYREVNRVPLARQAVSRLEQRLANAGAL